MPASFQDPARILIKYPGFSTPNDGANAIIFRGMPPESARWQLFGADIVNPNHLSNAGTANDLATGNAGGVNALSGSVLDYYHFEANPADVSYADVMSGVSNMKMAPKIRPFVDINLIGLEAGLGLSRGNKNVYASYRYSFVGLLDKLGVNFGNEKIGYQDLSLYADLIKNDHHSFKMFATLGNSSNIFASVSDKGGLTSFKDMKNIIYKSEMALAGAQYTYEKANKYFQSTLVSSGRNDNRTVGFNPIYLDSIKLSWISNQDISNDISDRLLSWHNQYILELNEKKLMLGVRSNLQQDRLASLGSEKMILSFYPYFQYQSNQTKKLKYNIGIGGFHDSRTKDVTLEPTLGVSYNLSDLITTSFNYRLSSYRDYTSSVETVQSFDRSRIKGHNLQIELKYLKKYTQIKAAVFLHRFSDMIPFKQDSSIMDEHFTSFNGSDFGYDQVFAAIIVNPIGTSNARVYGSELYLENTSFLNGNVLNYGVNVCVFDSKYNLANNSNNFFNGRYNFGYTGNVNISYTMDISKSVKNRKLIFSLSNHYRGAMREQSLNPISGNNISILYNTNSPYNKSFRPYQRLDFRIVYNNQKTGNKKSHRWSLDIQNLLNRENDGFRYYDPLLNSVLLQKQLGLVPVLSYRLEW